MKDIYEGGELFERFVRKEGESKKECVIVGWLAGEKGGSGRLTAAT